MRRTGAVKQGLRALRRVNIEKSKLAGAPVCEYSELERPHVKRTKRRRSKSARKKKKLAQSRKDNTSIRSERDALAGWRRAPGSFENGKRR
jgi:hypothetical protein